MLLGHELSGEEKKKAGEKKLDLLGSGARWAGVTIFFSSTILPGIQREDSKRV
jgi:hypothetical protein